MVVEGRTYPARWTARGCQVDVSYVYTRQYTRQYTRHSQRRLRLRGRLRSALYSQLPASCRLPNAECCATTSYS